MGVDITMAAGWGIHLTTDMLDEWQSRVDPEGDCAVEELLVDILPLGLFAFGADNAWLGERNGAVVYINRTVESFDMDRVARAGVYRAKQCEVTEDEQVALLRVAGEVAQQFIPVEFLVAVGVY